MWHQKRTIRKQNKKRYNKWVQRTKMLPVSICRFFHKWITSPYPLYRRREKFNLQKERKESIPEGIAVFSFFEGTLIQCKSKSISLLQTIVMYPRPNVITCTVRVWLREIGFSLTYGALMLKTWRWVRTRLLNSVLGATLRSEEQCLLCKWWNSEIHRVRSTRVRKITRLYVLIRLVSLNNSNS